VKNSGTFFILRLFLFPLFILTTFLNGTSQSSFRPGYYITWENDTVYGLIDYRGEVRNSSFCLFKKDETSEPKRYEPADIQAYRFTDSKYYVSRSIILQGQEKQVFLEFLVNGITNLYFYRDINYYSYFIENKNGEWLELTNDVITEHRDGKGEIHRNSNRYIGLLRATFADSPEIQPQIDRASLAHKSLINLTKTYHDFVCTDDEECTIYEKKLPLMKVRIAPVVKGGVAFLSFREGINSNYKFNPEVFPSAGILLNASLPRMNEKLSFELEVDVNSFNFHGSFEEENRSIKEYYDAYIDVVSLQPSLAVKYTIPTGRVKPSISAGVFADLLVSADQKIMTVKVHSDTIYSYQSPDIPMATFVPGGFVQLGSNFPVFKNKTAFINLRLNHAAKRHHGIRMQMQSVSLNLGMYLSKGKKEEGFRQNSR
jgi:hypothetical protein